MKEIEKIIFLCPDFFSHIKIWYRLSIGVFFLLLGPLGASFGLLNFSYTLLCVMILVFDYLLLIDKRKRIFKDNYTCTRSDRVILLAISTMFIVPYLAMLMILGYEIIICR